MSKPSSPSSPSSAQARLTLVNKRGLHARASHKFIECVMAHRADVRVTSHNEIGTNMVEADSIMELLLLGSACGEDISIFATGPDSEAVIKALSALVQSGFGETE